MRSAASCDEARLRFLARWLGDRAIGAERDVAGYQALYPGFEDVIAEEFSSGGSAPGDDSAALDPLGVSTYADRIGPYRIERELGRGGQAVVYLAVDERLKRRVALKIFTRSALAAVPTTLERGAREAQVASRLDHPNVCAVHDAGVINGVAWIAMRYVDGETLGTLIRQAREARGEDPDARPMLDLGGTAHQTPTARVLFLLETVARALHAAHEVGVIHRDVKPGNVIVTRGGDPVVVDFGLAREASADVSSLTTTGDVLGTPSYMAPEQLDPRCVLDRRVDVWALGVMAFECLTLERPFDVPTAVGVREAIALREPADPRRLNPALPRDVRAVLDTALSKDRARRYQTALLFAEDLRRLRVGEPVLVKRVSPASRLVRWARRRPAQAALGLVLLVGIPILMALGGFLAARWSDLEAMEKKRLAEQVDGIVEEGWFELEQGSPPEAEATFRRALARDPESPEALAGLVLTLTGRRDLAGALAELDSRPWISSHVALRRLRAHTLRDLGRTTEGREAEAALLQPETPLDFFVSGSRELLRGESGDPAGRRRALDLCRQAVLSAPQARAVYFLRLATAAARTRDPQVARDVGHALVHLWPESPLAVFYAGLANIDTDPGKAVDWLQRAVAMRPEDAQFRFNLGNALRGAKRPDAAIAEYERVLVRSPRHIGVLTNLGNILLDRNQLDAALPFFERAREVEPSTPDVLHNFAHCLELMGREDEALDAYRRVVAIAPRHALAQTNLGAHLIRRGRLAEAVVALERAAAARPESADLHLNLGVALREVCRFDHAIAATKRAIALEPANGAALVNLAVLLEESGAVAETPEAWRRVVTAVPANPEGWRRFGHALLRRGAFDDALQAFQKAEALSKEDPSATAGIDWVSEVEGIIASEAVLVGVAAGQDPPSNARGRLLLAELALTRGYSALAARLTREAMNDEEEPVHPRARMLAIRAAATAGRGAGIDAAKLSDSERGALRAQALSWLSEAAEDFGKRIASGDHEARDELRRLVNDPDVRGCRAAVGNGQEAAESRSWENLWGTIDRLQCK